ncbi:hypothetical protein ACFL51_00560 [Myxococcota bacterium]
MSEVKRKRGRPKGSGGPAGKRRVVRKSPGEGASAAAKRTASVVLEVLAGSLGPGEGAALLEISAPQYYKVEERALHGLVTACEPRPRGRVKTAEAELKALQKSHQQLEQECARLQALVRSLSRAAGLSSRRRKQVEAEKGRAGGKAKGRGKASTPGAKPKRGRKRPSVRALRHAAKLKENTEEPVEETTKDAGGNNERGEQQPTG